MMFPNTVVSVLHTNHNFVYTDMDNEQVSGSITCLTNLTQSYNDDYDDVNYTVYNETVTVSYVTLSDVCTYATDVDITTNAETQCNYTSMNYGSMVLRKIEIALHKRSRAPIYPTNLCNKVFCAEINKQIISHKKGKTYEA